MSYNARVGAMSRRATGDRGWEVGTNVSLGVGIPSTLVKTILSRTTPININMNGWKHDDRKLVVQQNTLSGVGRYRSQFNIDAAGIEYKRYYIIS
jgi:hypothetical protein